MSLARHPAEIPMIVLPSQSTTSLESFCEWTLSPDFPEQGCISFIAGEVLIDMSPERAETHNKVKACIYSTLLPFVSQIDLGTLYPDGMQLINKQARLSTEPDAMFATWETLKSGRLQGDRPSMKESVNLVGTPDWVLEVVSPSSYRKDKEMLPVQYHAAGIPEYWVINALEDEIESTLFIAGPNNYVASEQKEGWAFSPVFNREFKLTRKTDPVGLWQYTLEMREAK